MIFEKGKVSVIVISYNHAKFIEECINSILNQSYQDVEIIIVDNNSSDNTIKILDAYLKHEKIRVISFSSNRGIVGGINEGLKYVKGEFVTFFASDDIMMSDRFDRQVNFMDQTPDAAGCFGNMLRINEDGSINSKGMLPIVKSKEWILDDILYKRVCLYSPSQLYRTEIIFKAITAFPDHIKIEDIWLYHKLLSKGFKLYTIPYLLTLYRVHSTNTHTKFKMMMHEKINILNEYQNCAYYKKAMSFIYLEHFSNFCSSDKIEAVKLLPKVVTRLNSKYLYIGLLRLVFDWRG